MESDALANGRLAVPSVRHGAMVEVTPKASVPTGASFAPAAAQQAEQPQPAEQRRRRLRHDIP